ncbi:hypothetical protein PVK06_004022 [Gossypium arboreum]|uniref:Uncharacterized protein n=1 Tax=Gossypium arboreum TaxID=29729 RepID=A0ABR0QR37_GOSAR|nr:hypothetical protein PVK06_004022 [Gossypium arboreum]
MSSLLRASDHTALMMNELIPFGRMDYAILGCRQIWNSGIGPNVRLKSKLNICLCTITLEDVAMQLGLPIDSDAVTGSSKMVKPSALCYQLHGS